MNTILTDCEATANMRLFRTTTENVDDTNLLPIKPSHLVLGRVLNPLPTYIDIYEKKFALERKRQTEQKIIITLLLA